MSKFDETPRPPTSAEHEDAPTATVYTPAGDTDVVDAAPEEAPITPRLTTSPRPRDRLGRHVILERLGAGGMGVVYAAYDPKLDRKIAIKLLHPGRSSSRREQERLLREAQALARLDDPHVVKVFDIGTTGDLVYIAMEYVSGTSLQHWIQDRPRPPDEILDAFEAAGRGLAAAHNAGLVHGDFKSNNVLVRDDGQVKVLDFGLARAAESVDRRVLDLEVLETGLGHAIETRRPLGPGSPQLVALHDTSDTHSALVGTPAYMAPEQRRGKSIGPAADQFAYCVALYHALFGHWPFAKSQTKGQTKSGAKGDDPARRPRADVAADWRVVEPRDASRVPPHIFAVLARGLSFESAQRYPSMEALLADLRRLPWYRRPATRVVAVVAFIGLLLGAYMAERRNRIQPCRGAPEQLAEVWSAPRARAVSNAFATTDEVYAEASANGVRSLLDAYGARWTEMRIEACAATHLRREQSEQLLDRRVACLDNRLHELDTLVELFVEWPAETVQHAVEAASQLPPISGCADANALMAPVAAPDDERSRAAVATMRQRLAAGEAQGLAGRLQIGLEIAHGTVSDAETLGYWPLTAEALLLLGSIQEASSDAVAARATLQRALLAAQVGGHDRIAAEAFIRLVRITGHQLAEPEAANDYGRLAAALLPRLSNRRGLQADLADHLGLAALGSGELEEALAYHQKALQLRLLDDDETPDAAIARSRLRLGNAHKEIGNLQAARAELEAALELYLDILGPAHPEVAANLDRLGGLSLDAGDPEAAATYYRRALEILEQNFGSQHVRLGDTLSNYGLVHLALGQTAEALAIFERVKAIFVDAYGENHPNLAALWSNMGSAHIDRGEPAQALESFERALEIHLQAFGERHPKTGLAFYNLGEARLEMDQFAAALESHDRALDIWLSELPTDHYLIAHARAGRGRALLGLEEYLDAARELEEALRIWRDTGRDPVHRAEGQLALARCLWALGQRDRAVELARQARSTFRSASEKYRDRLREANRWLDEHSDG